MNRRTFLSTAGALAAFPAALRAYEPKVRVALPPKAVPVDLDRLLDCIAAVETGNDDGKVGPCGSRSRYQISYQVWFQHRGRSEAFSACRGARATAIARKHLEWLAGHMQKPTAFSLAWAWNGGLESWFTRDFQGAKARKSKLHDYATRVNALYVEQSV